MGPKEHFVVSVSAGANPHSKTGKIQNSSCRMFASANQVIAGWKPFTMRAPALVSVITITLALAAVVEILSQKSQKQGGLALRDKADEMPLAVTFGYLYGT